MPAIRLGPGAPPAAAAATMMEKVDAALNNMSRGLCMFGPHNRLLLRSDRYVKMHGLAPERLRIGMTNEMVEARKAAGTAYCDFGRYRCRRSLMESEPEARKRPASVHRVFFL
jgi:hypothetical protein